MLKEILVFIESTVHENFQKPLLNILQKILHSTLTKQLILTEIIYLIYFRRFVTSITQITFYFCNFSVLFIIKTILLGNSTFSNNVFSAKTF